MTVQKFNHKENTNFSSGGEPKNILQFIENYKNKYIDMIMGIKTLFVIQRLKKGTLNVKKATRQKILVIPELFQEISEGEPQNILRLIFYIYQ